MSCGTELNIVQEGVPQVIPTDACYVGGQESLNLLAKLVEPEIPDWRSKIVAASRPEKSLSLMPLQQAY